MRDMLISDTCVILDFCVINQLALLRRLDLRIVIPEDLLVDELSDWEKSIRSLGFALDSLSGNEMQKFFLPLMSQYQNSGLSYYDVLVLTLAKVRRTTLLTGDLRLRKAAVEQQVSLKGTIFLLEQLVIQKVLSVQATLALLGKMQKAGSRLPWNQAREMVLKAAKNNKA